MTAREIYESVLAEVNKYNAPSYSLEEFNYNLNKAILAFTNEKYSYYPVNQQLSDDLRVLVKHAKFNYNKNVDGTARTTATYNSIRGKVYSLNTTTTRALYVSSVADIFEGSVVKFADDRDANTTTYTVATASDITAGSFVVGLTYTIKTVGGTDYTLIGAADSVIGTVFTATGTGGGNGTGTATLIPIVTTSYPYKVAFTTAVTTITDGGRSVMAGDQIFIATAPVGFDTDYSGVNIVTSDATISTTLPASDYLHILSCRVFWSGQKANGQTAYLTYGAKRLTFDVLNVVQNNMYLRPAHLRPYFMVQDNVMNAGIDKITSLGTYKAYQNKPTITTHVGTVPSLVTLDKVQIDYLKIPEIITLSDIDIFTAGEDTSQVLEFPDYLKNEIVRRVTLYFLENTGNPRSGSFVQVNQEIPTVPFEMQGGQRQSQAPQAVPPPQ